MFADILIHFSPQNDFIESVLLSVFLFHSLATSHVVTPLVVCILLNSLSVFDCQTFVAWAIPKLWERVTEASNA